jgi:predicted short-subunit dehydrogenase-like oxidoreductase (DUF2520 family)
VRLSDKRRRFAIMGSGNVATHLAPALVSGGWDCVAAWSRSEEHAEQLARRLEAEGVTDRAAFLRMVSSDPSIDLLLLCVTDDGLAEIADELPSDLPATVLHTSGSTPMSILSRVRSYGVLYPIQTFSKSRAVEMSEVPLFVEANDDRAREVIRAITDALGSKAVRPLSSEERGRLHVAACFGCNFVNHMYALAADVLRDTSLSLSDLEPLLRETLAKGLAAADDPGSVQTGPAERRDTRTLRRHEELLRDDPSLLRLYRLLSLSIQERDKRRRDE